MVDLTGKTFCYYIDPTQDTEVYGGYVPSIVIMNESGHYPMIGDPEKHQTPWVWGKDLTKAEQIATEHNRRLGHSEEQVFRIMASSMRMS